MESNHKSPQQVHFLDFNRVAWRLFFNNHFLKDNANDTPSHGNAMGRWILLSDGTYVAYLDIFGGCE